MNRENIEQKKPIYELKLVNYIDHPLNQKTGPIFRLRIGKSGCVPGWGFCELIIFGQTAWETKN